MSCHVIPVIFTPLTEGRWVMHYDSLQECDGNAMGRERLCAEVRNSVSVYSSSYCTEMHAVEIHLGRRHSLANEWTYEHRMDKRKGLLCSWMGSFRSWARPLLCPKVHGIPSHSHPQCRSWCETNLMKEWSMSVTGTRQRECFRRENNPATRVSLPWTWRWQDANVAWGPSLKESAPSLKIQSEWPPVWADQPPVRTGSREVGGWAHMPYKRRRRRRIRHGTSTLGYGDTWKRMDKIRRERFGLIRVSEFDTSRYDTNRVPSSYRKKRKKKKKKKGCDSALAPCLLGTCHFRLHRSCVDMLQILQNSRYICQFHKMVFTFKSAIANYKDMSSFDSLYHASIGKVTHNGNSWSSWFDQVCHVLVDLRKKIARWLR